MIDSGEYTARLSSWSIFEGRCGQNYDVIEWTQEDILQDVIDQYERHLHFLNLVQTQEPIDKKTAQMGGSICTYESFISSENNILFNK